MDFGRGIIPERLWLVEILLMGCRYFVFGEVNEDKIDGSCDGSILPEEGDVFSLFGRVDEKEQ